MILYIIFWIIWLFILFFIIFILILKKKIENLEKKIKGLFQQKNDLIPALHELTIDNLIKHEQIFLELLKLKKVNFWELSSDYSINQTIYTQQKIHKEMDFIFRICQKHNKLLKSYKFNYLQELIFKRISDIWDSLEIYKSIIQKYNWLLKIKNFTLVWLLIPIQKKEEM